MEKEEKEPQALKMHCLSFVVERCAKNGVDALLKLLVHTNTWEDQLLSSCLGLSQETIFVWITPHLEFTLQLCIYIPWNPPLRTPLYLQE